MKILIIFLLTFSVNVFATTGKFLYTRGKVLVDNKLVKVGDMVKQGQTIITRKNSLAIVSLEGGSKVKINPKSEFVLTRINHSKRGTSTLLKAGNVFIKVLKKKLRGKTVPNKFFLKTKTAAMGVRGTEFFVSYGEQNKKNLWMCVNEGIVAIKSDKEKKVKNVKAGEGVVVKDGSKTSDPEPLPWTKNLNWNMNPAKGGVINKAKIGSAYKDLLDLDYD